MKTISFACALVCLAAGQTLDQAYAELRAANYDRAIQLFRQAAGDNPAARKDLAYTLLKVGENEAARDEFGAATRLDPADHHAALEFAFLANETGQQREARRIFNLIRKTGDLASRATAEQAFQNIDRPRVEGIARWSSAIESNPDDFSAHRDLARLADLGDSLDLAEKHYHAAWRLKPADRSLLVDLGAVLARARKDEAAMAALLAASRGAEPHTAERAIRLLPERYPYVYEFQDGLELDPGNTGLRREFAYLLLEMNRREEAEEQFRVLVAQVADDLLSAAQLGFLRLGRNDRAGAMPLLERVLQGGDEALADRVRSALGQPQMLIRTPEVPRSKVSVAAKVLAERSYEKGYLKDALKYLHIAHENDPVDFGVMLKLGWTHNLLHDDTRAWQWFDQARRAPDQAVAAEADRAFRNLAPALQRVRTTMWLYPMFSSRWHEAFAYGQIKTELRLHSVPIRPYVSMRFVGDTRGEIGGLSPEYLSESAFILGVGVATQAWRGLLGWFEAGTALSYLGRRRDSPAAVSDFRGGLAYGRGWGKLMGATAPGLFFETNDDAVFISRFENDLLLYSQNRTGFTVPSLQTQFFWNHNVTVDLQRLYWANFVETGPGLRFRAPGMPKSLVFHLTVLRGAYLFNRNNPRRPNFWDLRAGIWYALSK